MRCRREVRRSWLRVIINNIVCTWWYGYEVLFSSIISATNSCKVFVMSVISFPSVCLLASIL